MPNLKDHGLGGGGKSIGVPVYPYISSDGLIRDENGTLRVIFGDEVTALPAASYSNCGCAIGDDIYLIGMASDENACYKYNVKTKIWTELSDSPYSGQKAWAVAKDHNIYYGCAESASVYMYDTVNDAHGTLVSSTSHIMRNARAAIDGDYIYIFGGNYSTTYKSRADRVDIVNKTSTRLNNIPLSMYNHSVVNGGNGYIYLFGGMDNPTAAYKYSIAANSFTEIAKTTVNSYGAMHCRIDNYIYLINTAATLGYKSIQAYDVLTDTYIGVGNTENARRYGICGVVDDVIYMIGGGADSALQSTGDSMSILKFKGIKISRHRLLKGCKIHTDGDVNTGTIDADDILTINTKVDNINGVARIPSDGEYMIVDAKYATIGG